MGVYLNLTRDGAHKHYTELNTIFMSIYLPSKFWLFIVHRKKKVQKHIVLRSLILTWPEWESEREHTTFG